MEGLAVLQAVNPLPHPLQPTGCGWLREPAATETGHYNQPAAVGWTLECS